MYKVYTIGRKGGICSLVPREEGATRLCRQRGEKESGRKEDDWKPREFCLQPFVGFTSARCTNALIHTYISVCNHAYYWQGGREMIHGYHQRGEGRYSNCNGAWPQNLLVIWLALGWMIVVSQLPYKEIGNGSLEECYKCCALCVSFSSCGKLMDSS